MFRFKLHRSKVICNSVPKTSTCNTHTLILQLSNRDLNHKFVPWYIHLILNTILDFISSGFAQFFHIFTYIAPFFDEAIIHFGLFYFRHENISSYRFDTRRVESFRFIWIQEIGRFFNNHLEQMYVSFLEELEVDLSNFKHIIRLTSFG